VKVSRVLLVEDNPIMCRFVCAALNADDVLVTEAHTGAQALGLWAAGASDLVVQDTMLPDIDGFDLVARLRRLPGGGDVPILALSGLLSESEEARISAVGFSDVITKPLEVSRLRQVVRAHLPRMDVMPPRFGGGRRVLVVDDDAIQAKLISFRLSRLGFETLSARDGIQALRMAHDSPPDAIVSDIMMPVLDGFGLCAAVRRDPELSSIPLVLMTNSYVDDADRQLARAAGADEFVIRTPALLEVVEALRSSLLRRTGRHGTPTGSPDRLERVWTRRVMSQLERQVAINAGMARRSSILAAELAVLSGISDALANQQDTCAALRDVIGACMDAGSFTLGILHIPENTPELQLTFGPWAGLEEAELRALLARADRALVDVGSSTILLSTPADLRSISPFFAESAVTSVALVRVTRGGSVFGTLLMASKGIPQDKLAFLEAVATQIAQALTLTRAFADREASEHRAMEQAQVLRSVLETVAEGVVVTDVSGKFLFWNPAAERILGTGSERIPARDWPARFGLSFGENMAPVTPEQVPLVRALAGEIVDERQAFCLAGQGDGGKQVTISARPLRKNGVVSGAVAVVRDITEEKATQTRLLVADRLAAIGMLAAGVAHEINNPLAAVVANLDLAGEALRSLLEQPHTAPELAEISKMLVEANEASARVRRIVSDLRVFARGETDSSSAVDIHQVLESVLRLAKNEIRHRARVVRDFGDVAHVEGNESRLSQVFLNLVVNAVQALPEGQADQHEIRIRTWRDPAGRVVVTVSDTGSGIPAEAMKHLFVPFFTTKAVGTGTGLGLSICQRLVTGCGGEIKAESRPGEGASFHVSLRSSAGPAPAAKAEAAAQPQPLPAPRRGQILMVDDEPVILTILSRALGPSHDCVTTTKASEALQRVRAGEQFDLILCDLMMPVMDGRELYTELCRFAPEQAKKVVFLTGGAFTPTLQAFLATVPNASISKPFDVTELKKAVNARLQ
jgi:PAS domain S-box-containing protein